MFGVDHEKQSDLTESNKSALKEINECVAFQSFSAGKFPLEEEVDDRDFGPIQQTQFY